MHLNWFLQLLQAHWNFVNEINFQKCWMHSLTHTVFRINFIYLAFLWTRFSRCITIQFLEHIYPTLQRYTSTCYYGQSYKRWRIAVRLFRSHYTNSAVAYSNNARLMIAGIFGKHCFAFCSGLIVILWKLSLASFQVDDIQNVLNRYVKDGLKGLNIVIAKV